MSERSLNGMTRGLAGVSRETHKRRDREDLLQQHKQVHDGTTENWTPASVQHSRTVDLALTLIGYLGEMAECRTGRRVRRRACPRISIPDSLLSARVSLARDFGMYCTEPIYNSRELGVVST